MVTSTRVASTFETSLDDWLLSHVRCPIDKTSLALSGPDLQCGKGHRYPVIDGVPILLSPLRKPEIDIPPLDPDNLKSMARTAVPESGKIDPFVQNAIAATNGILYRSLIGQLHQYPIPHFPLENGNERYLLDMGCNWGRWTMAATRAGFRAVGIDPNPEAIFAARRVAKQLGLTPLFVVGDARYLPFAPGTFDHVFSYSVIQHFHPDDVLLCLERVGEILKDGGQALIQMANRFGLRGIFHQARRGFRRRGRFDVHYWTPGQLTSAWQSLIGPTQIRADGFLTLNPQTTDLSFLPLKFQIVVKVSESLRALSGVIPPVRYLADSLYLTSTKHSKASPALP